VSVALDTLGILLECYAVYPERFEETGEMVNERRNRLLGLILSCLASYREQVRQEVDSLPGPDREIFLRHYYYAQTVQEIARQMGLNESTIKTKLRRGRMKLKDILTREGFLREA